MTLKSLDESRRDEIVMEKKKTPAFREESCYILFFLKKKTKEKLIG